MKLNLSLLINALIFVENNLHHFQNLHYRENLNQLTLDQLTLRSSKMNYDDNDEEIVIILTFEYLTRRRQRTENGVVAFALQFDPYSGKFRRRGESKVRTDLRP